ncbi:hypothetical protein [Halobacteriovorax sp. RT-1-4]|uniref:hypothetical protein n=1 Tax=unclassified Halobacteriovorax TaxID=2639665 RepID=UPI003999E306
MRTKELYNPLVGFLIGEWDNISFEISNGKEVKREVYPETMVGKSEHVITITAHGFRDGKDLTKDMCLEVKGEKVIMSQGPFRAEGIVKGNVYYLEGKHEDMIFKFRLYTMGDKYVFHRETWKNGNIQQMDMSYLVRKK